MKKTLIALVLATASVWAAEGNVYHTIADPTWHVTRIGSRWVIEDSKGFFVGYYVPQQVAPVAPAASSAPATTATAPTAPPAPPTQSNAGGSYSNNYGYGNYGYGYNGYGNNGFYGNNYYNNGNCPPQSHQPEPPLQPGRDKNDIPVGGTWSQVYK